MKCFCEKQVTYEIKLEGDVGADPTWCIQCGCNLEIEELPVSNEMKGELNQWAMAYGEWINWETDKLLPNARVLEEEHNRIGLYLTEKLRKELNKPYKIEFSPSTMVSSYPR